MLTEPVGFLVRVRILFFFFLFPRTETGVVGQKVLNAYIHMHTNTKAVLQLLLSTPEKHKLSRNVLIVKETECTGAFFPFPHFPGFSAAMISSVRNQQRVELRFGLQR